MKISTMVPLACCLVISFVLPVELDSRCTKVQGNLSDLNPPTNLMIVDRQLGELTISWNDSLSEIRKANICVRYPFEYKYFDSQTWQEDSRLLEPEYTKAFELHRGVYIRVKSMVLTWRKIIKKESNWTVIAIQPPPGDQETLASDVSCIIYNYSFMNCTWRRGSKAPHDTRYIMYYRQDGNTAQCTHYFVDEHGRQGCHVAEIKVDVEKILLCINGSSNSTLIQAYYTEFNPQEHEIYNQPENLRVLPNLTVMWDVPPDNECTEYQLNVTNLDQGSTELLSAGEETKYVLGSINPTKRYSLKVRRKAKHTCNENMFWSEWSNEVFIEPTRSFNMHWILRMLAIVIAMVAILLIFAFRRYRVLEIAFKPIPDPQKKFKALFEEYNGDFQNWINCRIPVSTVDECHPVVIEESPQNEA
ncbi:interleukin-13 receptor subunit alpha-2-like [Stegostoma tigrinum]|uniref:interleukin-13 receptor subunit alpha-2-like n=1 Tax=Stegostoma tigrinum TaxID=3053191 RepID=UPI00287045D3|nr:interleukin-13 receptor subunit alpha-2-like [Stegostoma tigrinum]